ncbi:hypothetical protein [Paenibacillus soyae]|uniref:Uncharacterized protein n=1 Tax=Paenibacillus soyae TaxID=2969249 RepID=A0A9X2SBR5_9BACL|nr:hypothetical protein [Paenibacillus soyae]MCR2805913.1 hypothetical protein [Paenibacillus soyae]
MASLIGVLAIAGGVFWLEAPGLLKRKRVKEMVWFVSFLLIGTGLYGALTLEAKLPNPFKLLEIMFGWAA